MPYRRVLKWPDNPNAWKRQKLMEDLERAERAEWEMALKEIGRGRETAPDTESEYEPPSTPPSSSGTSSSSVGRSPSPPSTPPPRSVKRERSSTPVDATARDDGLIPPERWCYQTPRHRNNGDLVKHFCPVVVSSVDESPSTSSRSHASPPVRVSHLAAYRSVVAYDATILARIEQEREAKAAFDAALAVVTKASTTKKRKRKASP